MSENTSTLVADLLSQAAWHTAQEVRYRTAIEVLTGEQPRALRASSAPALIMDIVSGAPDRAWRVADLLDAMTSRGWHTSSSQPDAVVRTAVCRLRAQGSLEWAAPGLYRPRNGR